MPVMSRSLYQYVNNGIESDNPRLSATLYHYVNNGHEELHVESRLLYLYVNNGIPAMVVLRRSLYEYEAYTNEEIFPWIERIVPNEQYPGGQVAVHGDGFGAQPETEDGSVRLGVYDPNVSGPGLAMGVVSWQTRSPGLYPANSGVRSTAAIVVTVPTEGESGMLSVELTT